MGKDSRHRRNGPRRKMTVYEKAEREGALMLALAYGGVVALLLAVKLVFFG